MRSGLVAALSFTVACSFGAGGCGGGGGQGAAPAAGPLVVGKVVSRDGQPLLLDGIAVECVNDGVTVTTGADGSFTLEVPGGVVVRVRFTDPLAVGVFPDLPPCHENGDDTPDEGDVADDVVTITPLVDGDVCVIEVEIAGGRVIECGMDLPPRPGDFGPNFHGEGVLVPLDALGESSGEVEVEMTGAGCATLEIEAEGLTPSAAYGVLLVSPELAQATPGALIADATGAAHLSLAGCTGDVLPFGVAQLTDLAGYGVVIVDADGVPVLAGQIPGHGPEYGEPGYGGGGGVPGLPPGLPPIPGLPGDLPPMPGLPGDLPSLPGYDDLLDLLNDLFGGTPYGLPGLGG